MFVIDPEGCLVNRPVSPSRPECLLRNTTIALLSVSVAIFASGSASFAQGGLRTRVISDRLPAIVVLLADSTKASRVVYASQAQRLDTILLARSSAAAATLEEAVALVSRRRLELRGEPPSLRAPSVITSTPRRWLRPAERARLVQFSQQLSDSGKVCSRSGAASHDKCLPLLLPSGRMLQRLEDAGRSRLPE